MTKPPRTLGVTVLTDFILNEGVDAILANITDRAHATAVAINPTVTSKSEEGEGSFQPPADAGSSPRLFDRPLWGKRALWVKSGPSFVPNGEHYSASPYGPRKTNDLTVDHGAIVKEFIDAAQARGLDVYLQINAAKPTGLRDDDRPRLPDGSIPRRMADTACLASPAVRAYNRAYAADLLEHYPNVAGFRIDWPEYPCYMLGEAFQGFGTHVQRWAAEHGFDYPAIVQAVGTLYERLHGGLKNDHFREIASVGRGVNRLVGWLMDEPLILEWLKLKASLSADLIRDWRTLLDDVGGADKHLSAHAFMPPFSRVTGLDFRNVTAHCQSVSPKFYTMHWSQIVDYWSRPLLESNPGLSEKLVVKAIVYLLDLVDVGGGERLADYGYPGPDEPHPVPNGPQQRKIDEVLNAVGGAVPVWPLIHGYGPIDDFTRRFRIVAESAADGAWINRYGYLSDEKLDAVGACWK